MSTKEIFEAFLREAQELKDEDRAEKRIISRCEYYIRDVFGNDSSYLRRLSKIDFSTSVIRIGGRTSIIDSFESDKKKLIELIQDILDNIDLIEMRTTETRPVGGFANTDEIFVVHGHDEAMKQEVARFIEKLGLRPIILNELANTGNTIIEKLEKHSNLGFAVILLSPCDEGRKMGSGQLLPRARQNVIAEMGYFVGKIGRNRVCVLKKSDVEEPSDFTGIVYTAFDENGGWKLALCRELNAAGYAIDANKALL